MGQYPSARAAAYADDGFVYDKLLTVLRTLAALKHAFKEDLGMELTLPKCKVLIPGLSQEDANAAIRTAVCLPHMSHPIFPPPRMLLPSSSHPYLTMYAHPACISAWGGHYTIQAVAFDFLIAFSLFFPPHTRLPLYHHSSCNK
jgi:DNA-binding transcriptional LysR family regulator